MPERAALAGLYPLPCGLLAITGGERSGKTRLLRRLCGDLAPLPGANVANVANVANAARDAQWLDLALPEQGDAVAQQVWQQLRACCPRWSEDLQQQLAVALGLQAHLDKKLFMLSAGTRRKVGLVGLLACGARVTCLDQPYAALDHTSIGVVREFLQDMAEHPSRTWVVADYEADPHLPWRRVLVLD
ncbi:MAG: ATP-binding cassette domain-containing protein [Rhodoferax sp.]